MKLCNGERAGLNFYYILTPDKTSHESKIILIQVESGYVIILIGEYRWILKFYN